MSKYIIFSSIIFIIGMFGIFFSRKHLIIVLMALELLLLASNINFVVFSIFLDDICGQIYSLTILTIGATESAIGLALLLIFFRKDGSIQLNVLSYLKG